MAPSMRLTEEEKEEQKAQKVSALQIKDLSFTNSGRAFQHPPGFEDSAIYINARTPSSKPYKKIITVEPPEGQAKSRMSVSLTEKETQEGLPSGMCRYMLVGWIPQNPDVGNVQAKLKYGAIVGITRPPKQDTIVFEASDIDHVPLMVVTKVSDKDSKTPVAMYVLLRQHEGVCTPYTAGADEVYYLPMFRDNSTSKLHRKANWNRIVRKYAMAPSASAQTEKDIIEGEGEGELQDTVSA